MYFKKGGGIHAGRRILERIFIKEQIIHFSVAIELVRYLLIDLD